MRKLATISKRSGRKEHFDQTKILNAISKANREVTYAHDKMKSSDIVYVTEKVVETLEGTGAEITVELCQDTVEKQLIKYGFAEVAKKYIIYRNDRARLRDGKNYLMKMFNRLTFHDAKDEDVKRENANIDANSAMGTMLKYGSTSSNYFVDTQILPKDIAAAHVNGDIHIHDKDFYMLTETCCQIDLLKLFKGGFSTGHGFLREPNSITSAAALACIAIQANQNDMHGGQSVPHFDYAMAPYVLKTFKKEYKEAMELCCHFTNLMTNDEIKEEFENKFEHSDMDDSYLAVAKKHSMAFFSVHKYAYERALARTDRATYQAMEALIHNLNTMNSRAGAQVPFSSINYGTATSAEGRMVMKNLLMATQAGLGDGETPIFPVQIFKVQEGVNFNPEDPNYDLFQLAINTSAQRLFPNFSFLDSPFNKQYLRKNEDGTQDWNSEVAYMGCRTRVMANPHDPTKEVTCGRGNLSFTTLNLPRLGILAKGDIDTFFCMLNYMINLVFRQLKHRLKIQGQRKVHNYPFLMRNCIWLDSDDLGWDDTIGEILKHGTLTVGFIGLAEALKALIGCHHGESPEAQELGLRIIRHMRERCDAESRKDRLNYSLIGTPAESTCGRFVPLDRELFGSIEGVTDRDYYTNSFHIPVYYTIRAFEKIRLEAPYHALTNGGHITYVELDGDTSRNPEAFEKIIRYMHDQGVGYGSINHPVDRDPGCGYVGVINDVCPRCGRRDGEAIPIERLKKLRKRYGNNQN